MQRTGNEATDQEVRAASRVVGKLTDRTFLADAGVPEEAASEIVRDVLAIIFIDLMRRGAPMPASDAIDQVLGTFVIRARIDLTATPDAIDQQIVEFLAAHSAHSRLLQTFRRCSGDELTTLVEQALRKNLGRFGGTDSVAAFEQRTDPKEGQSRGGLAAAMMFRGKL